MTDELPLDMTRAEIAAAAAFIAERRREAQAAAEVAAAREARLTRLGEAVASMTGGRTLVIHAAMQNGDLTEGKDGSYPRGYFLDEGEAERAEGWLAGVYGGVNKSGIRAIRVYLTAEDWLEDHIGNVALSTSGNTAAQDLLTELETDH